LRIILDGMYIIILDKRLLLTNSALMGE